MTRNRRTILGRLVLAALVGAATTWSVSQAADPAPTEPLKLLEPQPLVPGEGGNALARGLAHAPAARGVG